MMHEYCDFCGSDASDNWFDRSVCPCGMMHTRCGNCGSPLDNCPYEPEPEWVPMENIRGRVWSETRDRRRTWYYEASVSGRVMLADNTGSYERVANACLFAVAALRRIYIAGHRLQKDYPQILRETRG